MLKFDWVIKDENSHPDYSYDWTPFGRAVMESKGIKQWTLEEFKLKRPDEYNELDNQRKKYNH